MKKILLLCLTTALFIPAFTQNNTQQGTKTSPTQGKIYQSSEITVTGLPEVVKENFGKEYPDAKDTQWTKSKDNWMANFTLGGFRATATYHSSGRKVQAQIRYTIAQAPEPVKKAILEKFSDLKKESDLIRFELPDGKVRYRIFVKDSGKTKAYVLDAEGKWLD